MKNILKGLFFMSMAAVLFSGCQKDGDMMSFGATADRFSSDDKAYMDGSYMQWNASDRVMINGTGYDLVYANGTATISGVTKDNNDVYAAQYPEAMNGAFNSATTTFTTISISSTRPYTVKDGVQVVEAPMVAYVDASNNNQNNEVLRFKNVSALYKLNLTNGFNSTFKVSKISVATNSNACPLTGNGFSIINVSGSKPTLSKDARIVDADSMATMTFTDGQVKVEAHNNTPVTIYFPLPPTNSSAKFTFRVYGTMGGAECVFTRSVTLASTQASKLYTVPISLTNDNYTTVKGAAFSGSGTSNDPYKIATADDFSKLALCVNNDSSVANGFTAYKNAYYEVTATGSISLSGFTPIGTSSKPFLGHFNGNGVTITSLSISGSYAHAGLFGYCNGATIEKLCVNNVTVTNSNTNAHIGGFVGHMEGGSITTCKFGGTLVIKGSVCQYLGCFAGYVSGATISKVYIKNPQIVTVDISNISSRPMFGHVAGYAASNTVNNFYINAQPNASFRDGAVFVNYGFFFGTTSQQLLGANCIFVMPGLPYSSLNDNVRAAYRSYLVKNGTLSGTDATIAAGDGQYGEEFDPVFFFNVPAYIGDLLRNANSGTWGYDAVPELTIFSSNSKSAKGTKSKGAKGPQMAPAYAGFYQGR